jgi:hypothetical protein
MARTGGRFGKIQREHVEAACRELIKSGTFASGGSYFVRFDEHDLPAKRVLREAYRLANERDISTKEFSGGQFTAQILKGMGFEVVVR